MAARLPGERDSRICAATTLDCRKSEAEMPKAKAAGGLAEDQIGPAVPEARRQRREDEEDARIERELEAENTRALSRRLERSADRNALGT